MRILGVPGAQTMNCCKASLFSSGNGGHSPSIAFYPVFLIFSRNKHPETQTNWTLIDQISRPFYYKTCLGPRMILACQNPLSKLSKEVGFGKTPTWIGKVPHFPVFFLLGASLNHHCSHKGGCQACNFCEGFDRAGLLLFTWLTLRIFSNVHTSVFIICSKKAYLYFTLP